MTTATRPEWQVTVPIVDLVFVVALSLVVLLRLWWIGSYIWTFWRHPSGMANLASVRWALSAPSAHVFRPPDEATADDAEHRQQFVESARQVDTLLLIGSVALAAWTQLFTGSGQAPGNALSGLTRGLLLASAIILIAGPGLFRSTGSQFTFMGRETATIVGFAALVLSLASALADLFGTTGALVGFAIAAALVLRDAFEIRNLIGSHQYLRTDRP